MQLHVSSPSSAPASPLGTAQSPHHIVPTTQTAAEHLDSHPACCHNCFYGPHTSTIRVNPYVRCVHGSGVPVIRSLKELLSLKNQPAPAEPDTPCLRPTHGPVSTWQAPTSTLSSAYEHTDPVHAAREGQAAVQVSSPALAFTADSVATPNTFATVVTHEKRIISHLTRRLRSSVRRHQDMPFGEPMEMVLSEDEEADEEAAVVDDDDDDASSRDEDATGDGVGSAAEDGEVEEVPMLPSSTRDKAAEAETQVQARAQTQAATTEATSSEERHTVDPTAATMTSCSASATTTDTSPSPQAEQSLARPCTPNPMHQHHQQQQQQQWLMQVNNERIVSPHSSSGMLCEFPGAQQAAVEAHRCRPSPHAHSDSHLLSLSGNHPSPHTPQRHGAQLTAALRSYPAPVAKLEESPYHYIMRNYIGGTFLYYSTAESKAYFLRLCHRVVAQVRPLLEQETLSPLHGLCPRLHAPAYVFGDIHGNFEDLSFFLKRLLIFHDFNLTPANILCLGDYVDRGPFSLECVMLLFSLKIMNASKIVMLRGNHEDRVVCGDLQTYGRGCFLGQCQTVFGYTEGMKLFKEVTALFKYLPLAAELVVPSTPNIAFLRSQQTVMHPNLYVSQPAVLLHDAAPVETPPASTPEAEAFAPSLPYGARRPHPGGEVASGDSGDDALSKSSTTSASPTSTDTTATTTATNTTAGYSTIADASLARGQPSRHEAHEERILCTHGGIPRFDRPPLEDNALDSLRSLAFPRMLTLFPNNPMAKDDPECAPDYFARKELPTLWRRYPSTAPAAFTEASRRESAEAAAAASATSANTTKARKLKSSTSSVSCGHEDGRASRESPQEKIDHGRPDSTSSTASSSSASSQMALAHGCGSDKDSPLQVRRPLLQRSRSRDFLPLPTDEAVRKAWYTMFDLLWSDPTPMELEEDGAAGRIGATGAVTASCQHVNEWGFGINTRGSNVVSFSAKAVDTFLTAHHYSMLFRAHQEKAHGLRWSKSNKVLTIFSSSNYMGHGNGAGCVVVAANGEVQMVEKVCL